MSTTDTEKWAEWDSKRDCFARYAQVRSILVYGQVPAEKPDVSIMIPTFRRADTLKETVDSALGQKTRYRYVICVLDNDADGDEATDRLMKEYCGEHSNVLYYRHEQNIGMYGNWNRCAELSPTEWYCMVHDDDMLMENYIEKVYSIAKNSECGLIGSYKTNFDEREDVSRKLDKTGRNGAVSFFINAFVKVRKGRGVLITNKDARYALFPPIMTSMANRTKMLSIGGYDDRFYPPADAALLEKMMKYYGVLFLPEPLFYFRVGKNDSLNITTAYGAISGMASLMEAVQRSLGRSDAVCRQAYHEGVVLVYNSFPGTKESLAFSEVAERLSVPPKYNNSWLQRWVMLKYYMAWGKLLFRRAE